VKQILRHSIFLAVVR